MAVNREALRSEEGFTLAEVMVYSFLLLLILVGLYTLLDGALRSWQAQENMVEVQQNARLAMERMVGEIRGCKAIIDDGINGRDSTASSIYFWASDLNNDGDYWVDDGDGVPEAGEEIDKEEVKRFHYANNKIYYALTTANPLAEYLSAPFTISYYNGATDISAEPPSDEENANRIKIFFTVSKGNFTKNYSSSATIRSKLI